MAEEMEVTSEGIEIVPVRAVAVLASTNSMGGENLKASEIIQGAMAMAVEQAYADGVTDPKEIRKRSLVARELAKEVLFAPLQKEQK